MDKLQHTSKSDSEETPQLRGLYKNVNITVKALNVIIIACILLIIFLVAMDLRKPGLTITFDSLGGSDVAFQEQMYGERLVLPDSPTREGYSFTGWYKDYGCFEPWNLETDTIQSELTLYAGWKKTE